MSAGSSSQGFRRSPRLGKKTDHGHGQSGWSPDSLEQEEVDNHLPFVDEVRWPIPKVVLKKMSRQEIAQVTGGEERIARNGDAQDYDANQRNAEESASVLLDVSVIELDQEENELDDSPPPALTESEAEVSSDGSLSYLSIPPGNTQTALEDVITIDDEEERDLTAEDDIMILGDQVTAEDISNPDSLAEDMSNTPSANRNDTTIDLTMAESPVIAEKVKTVESSSNAGFVPKASPDVPSREPLTCPICFESYIALSKENVKLLILKCGHVCCGPCLQETLQRRLQCPICRAGVRRGDLRQIFL